jgi:hypothetical protein
LGEGGEAEARQRRVQDRRDAVEDKLTVDFDVKLLGPFLEHPGKEGTMRWQAQVDAGMLRQILRLFRLRSVLEVGWSANHGHRNIRPDAYGNHVLGHKPSAADAGIIATADDIGEALIGRDLKP